VGATPIHSLPYPEPTDPPAGATQIRALAESLDPIIARTFETAVTVPAASGVASGAVIPGTPITVDLSSAGFTAPPTVIPTTQSLPAGGQFVRVGVTAISANSCQIFAYNISHQSLNLGGPITVAVIAIDAA
jgi:hypothetical protein